MSSHESTRKITPLNGGHTQWYYNIETGAVEHGKLSSFSNRLGPYGSYEEAEEALAIARERNRIADENDAEDDDDWGSP
ncbi:MULTISPECIES: hypothetical protein [unclassified Corynebacterium]|uniref:hypothetical protein n=1 Tax=unclassified Corynebacterium TaxID=2624378 RepID=UPI002168317E|nr:MULTISPECIES: hypothetical protein [unclassified Corynebacterium]MCS4490617.1 hypothetical protein [Corynebacterium sp. ES2775-CONJ]MCS4532412.1 hypothetical protein [Corynebacterium sp. ES2730-CONJ]